jgi:hypothetical protein
MHLYIIFNKLFDNYIFNLWFNHYTKLKLNFGIFVHDNDLDFFSKNFPSFSQFIINFIPDNVLYITEKDFLFSYTNNLDDELTLSYTIDPSFTTQSLLIGKVFYVPVKNKKHFTTFEIPDFILYKHADHTNFTKNGLYLNSGSQISNNILCLNLNISLYANENEYYETDILVKPLKKSHLFNNVYKTFLMNVNISKEHKYGIIWHPKCACTTITHIFCLLNKIYLNYELQKSLCFYYKKYRYNCYLQNIEYVTFVRNPYDRFISTFLDKHVYKTDNIFITLTGYREFIDKYKVETMNNISFFLLNKGYISNHYTLMSDCFLFQKHKYTIVKIEDNLSTHLYNFFKKYHKNIDDCDIFNKFENVKHNKEGKKICESNFTFSNYDPNLWTSFLNEYSVNYKTILNSHDFQTIKKNIYNYYIKDFELFNYI